MAKLSVSVDVPLPPEQAWQHASDLSRYKEWLTIHRVWRSKLPDTLDKGTVVESIVEVKGMPNRIRWTIVHFKPPEAMTLNGIGVGGVKVKLIGKVRPQESDADSSVVTEDYIVKMADQYFIQQNIVIGHLNHPPVTHTYPALLDIIRSRKLRTVTLNDVFLQPEIPHVTSA
mgnify:CR=1 FL=1